MEILKLIVVVVIFFAIVLFVLWRVPLDFFKFTVVIVAFVILILYLTWVGSLVVYSNKNTVYPPVQNPCPDNWMSDASGNCFIPQNRVNQGTVLDFARTNPSTFGYNQTTKSINFNDAGWSSSGISAQCNQRLWAVGNKINWDTITNYNQC